MVEIRQRLPDDAGLRERRMNDGHRQIINFQPLVVAKVPGERDGSSVVGPVLAVAVAGGRILMAGAGEQENLLMARTYGNHARSAYDDQQKGE